jgi:enoyl-CoA hydratase/carnithine racemase
MESSLTAGLEAMQAQLSLLNTTQDTKEGVTAFLEKRKPVWQGR